uniref:undecaprenyldiphospho-muramoylpentapeptide beta-N-acetylglucosaminyltransferase n=1 Tax=Flavobacterium sp. TaxID=239 RepID=UPI004049CB81
MKAFKFILSGGGTGGHIYPAIAIANELKRRFPDAQFLFVGAQDKMEMQKVPEAGYQIKGLWIAGLQRTLTLQNLLFPVKLIKSILDARKIIKDFQPDFAIGTGGFASGPLLKAASQMNIPTLIQEQNSYPGITNKWLSKKALKICVAYPHLESFFPADKIVFTGNPVREDLLNLTTKKEEGLAHFDLKTTTLTLLVLGGSLGARAINQLVASNLAFFESKNVQIIWQCGKFYAEQYQIHQSETVKVHPFISKMDLAYAAADIIISRAGASSVSELCLVGKPVIFIPSPHVAEDHQTKNAQAITNDGAALLLRESQIEQEFVPMFTDLVENENKRKALGTKILALGKPKATQDIVDLIEQIVKNKA